MSVSSWIRRQFKNGVSVTDTVPGGFTNSATVFTAADGTTFPDGSVGPFIITADQGLATEEKILIQSRSGAVFTIAASGRGYNGGSAQNHGSGCTIFHTMDSQDLDEANQVAVATLGAIQASGDLLQGSGANALARLARGAANTFLQVQGSSLGYVAFGSGGTTAIASSGADGTSTSPARYDHTHSGVTSVNGVAGAVTAANILSAVEAAFGAANQVVLGTGAGAGTLATLANGYGITGFAANPPTPAVALSSAAGSLGSPYSTTNSFATFLSTASLAVGTWLVSLNCNVQGAGGAEAEIKVVAGTATATFAGNTVMETSNGGTSTQQMDAGITFIATVTVAGTLAFQAFSSGTSCTIQSATAQSSLANATGYTAVRIA